MNDREQEQLDWAADLGRVPEIMRPLMEPYPKYLCYRYGTAHVKIFFYEFGGTYGQPEIHFDVVQGRDSIYPGIVIKHVSPEELTPCDCGNFMFPSKEQAQTTKIRAKRIIN